MRCTWMGILCINQLSRS